MAIVTTHPTNLDGIARDSDHSTWESPLLVVGDSYEPSGLIHPSKHWEAGVIFCNSSGVQVAATGGTVAVDVMPWATLFYEPPTQGASITATAPVLSSWQCRMHGVRFVPTGIATATHYKVRLAVAQS